jgi:phospholipid transport system substrate-binding protein
MSNVRYALAAAAAVVLAAPATAAINNQEPTQFVTGFANEGFAALRTGSRTAAKAQFRTLLAQHVAVDAIGERLIRRWAGKITPAQKAAYKAVLPNYIIGTYADRLFDYARADFKVVRSTPMATGVDVTTQVTNPGAQPITAIWSLGKIGSAYKVTNLKVGGVNLTLTQAADFDAIVQRKGFDALVEMMKARS